VLASLGSGADRRFIRHYAVASVRQQTGGSETNVWEASWELVGDGLIYTEPVIATLDLFATWREEDADCVRRLLFQDLAGPARALADGSPHGAEELLTTAEQAAERKWGWRSRRPATG
jgi:hypothetical protein